MKRRNLFGLAFVLLTAMSAVGQVEEGENITLWNDISSNNLFNDVDTLWMGGVFLRDTSKPLVVWLHGNGASINGNLYLMVPGYADSAYYLFHNHQNPSDPNSRIDLTDFGVQHMDTLYFLYAYARTSDPTQWRTYSNKRFTGPNRRATDGVAEGAPVGGWEHVDRYSSDNLNTGIIPGNSYPNYRRWAVAGWMQENVPVGPQHPQGRARTDTVAFGFEDLSPGDGDFDDIVYHITGVFLNRPNIVDSLRLSAEPAVDTIPAGDSVVFSAQVFMDSLKENGQDTIVHNPAYDSLVTWQVVGPPDPDNPGLRFGAGPSPTNTFYGVRAYQTYSIIATFTDELGNSKSAELSVTVMPGPADHIVIEASPDSAGKLWHDAPRELLSLGPGTDFSEEFYAIVRDQYNNWIGPANPANWTSAAPSIAEASRGSNVAQGQGRADRGTDLEDSTVFTASYLDPRTGNTLSDDMTVSLQSIYYTAIRIGVRIDNRFIDINTLEIATIDDTTLWVQGQRSDGQGWEYIDGTWTAANIVLAPAQASGSSWGFSPVATGEGTIVVTTANSGTGNPPLRDEISVSIFHGQPDRMVLYREEGDPAGMIPIPAAVTTTAGDTLDIVAKLFDSDELWLLEYEQIDSLRNRITWTVNSPDAAVLASQGHATQFTSTVAHAVYEVTARYNYEGIILSATVSVKVDPAQAADVYIEATSDKNFSPNEPSEIDTITIPENETSALAYAVLRDRFGNFVSASKYTDWISLDTLIATAASTNADTGEGQVTKNPTILEGTVTVQAEDVGTGFTDSVVISILRYHYIQLSIYDANGVELDTLEINTNQNAVLYVKGLRSDTAVWEDVSALWSITASLEQALTAPGSSHEWDVSPVDTASGWIRVTKGDTTVTTPDRIYAHFTPGPPTSVGIEITTPASELIAGEVIDARLTVLNADGNPVAGHWCGTTSFGDILDTVVAGAEPKVIIDGVEYSLNEAIDSVCFDDGYAEVSFMLYYAPASRDPHQINVTLTGSTQPLSDITEPFILLPGELARIEIVGGMEQPLDSVSLEAPDESIVLISKGYDAWGNPRGTSGNEPADWSVNYSATNPLHEITRPDGEWRLYYETSTVEDDEQGWIYAVDTTNGTIRDSVWVAIGGPPTSLTMAVTLDTNGNGYLDGVELYFNRPITLPTDSAQLAALLATIDVEYYGTELNVAGLVPATTEAGATSMTDSVFVAILAENRRDDVPQTSWLPQIKISGLPGVRDMEISTDAFTKDGAGPVIWEVTKYVEEGSPDRVEVVMSEPIRDALDGGALNTTTETIDATELFVVYEKNVTTGEFSVVEGILDDITLSDVRSDSIVVFVMDNGNDLVQGHHYLNIAVTVDSSGVEPQVTARITDDAIPTNLPLVDNRKEIVQINGDKDINPQPYPNPAVTDDGLVPAPIMESVHNPRAHQYVWEGGGGVAIRFELERTFEGTLSIHRSVYDVAGNLVQNSSCEDFMSAYVDSLNTTLDQLPSTIAVDLYWNGFNAEGLPVAPGVYREVLYFQFSDPQVRDQRKAVTYGIMR